jgi:hypothetical protein
MSKVTVRILTQVFENKAWSEGGHAWSPKGGQEIIVEVASDTICYADSDKVLKVLKRMVEKNVCGMYKYKYMSHEVIFGEPIIMDEMTFDVFLEEEYNNEREMAS